MTHIVIERNDLPRLLSALPILVQGRTEAAMKDGRGAARGALSDGIRPENDTTTLSEGMVVSTPSGDDEPERKAAARTAFLRSQNTDKGRARFDALCGEAVKLAKAGEFEALATLSVLMAYGALWENGHDNPFTKQYEHSPWFAQAIYSWAVNELANAYNGVIEEALR